MNTDNTESREILNDFYLLHFAVTSLISVKKVDFFRDRSRRHWILILQHSQQR